MLQQRIIETADQYHYIAEEQWDKAIDLQPESEDAAFEFRRLIRAALQFYLRALLMLDMVESDDEQQLEDLLDVAMEQNPEIAKFIEQNQGEEILDEESDRHLSQLFSVAEVLRNMLLDRSTQLAATLPERFAARE